MLQPALSAPGGIADTIAGIGSFRTQQSPLYLLFILSAADRRRTSPKMIIAQRLLRSRLSLGGCRSEIFLPNRIQFPWRFVIFVCSEPFFMVNVSERMLSGFEVLPYRFDFFQTSIGWTNKIHLIDPPELDTPEAPGQ
jgi:hypothetical protein